MQGSRRTTKKPYLSTFLSSAGPLIKSLRDLWCRRILPWWKNSPSFMDSQLKWGSVGRESALVFPQAKNGLLHRIWRISMMQPKTRETPQLIWRARTLSLKGSSLLMRSQDLSKKIWHCDRSKAQPKSTRLLHMAGMTSIWIILLSLNSIRWVIPMYSLMEVTHPILVEFQTSNFLIPPESPERYLPKSRSLETISYSRYRSSKTVNLKL